MKIIGTIIKAVFMAYLVIFAVINMQSVQLTLFFGLNPIPMPMFLFTIFVIFIGFLAGVLLMVGEKLATNSQIKQLKKQLTEAGNEINRLKNIPLATGKSEETQADQQAVESQEQAAEHNTAIKDILR